MVRGARYTARSVQTKHSQVSRELSFAERRLSRFEHLRAGCGSTLESETEVDSTSADRKVGSSNSLLTKALSNPETFTLLIRRGESIGAAESKSTGFPRHR